MRYVSRTVLLLSASTLVLVGCGNLSDFSMPNPFASESKAADAAATNNRRAPALNAQIGGEAGKQSFVTTTAAANSATATQTGGNNVKPGDFDPSNPFDTYRPDGAAAGNASAGNIAAGNAPRAATSTANGGGSSGFLGSVGSFFGGGSKPDAEHAVRRRPVENAEVAQVQANALAPQSSAPIADIEAAPAPRVEGAKVNEQGRLRPLPPSAVASSASALSALEEPKKGASSKRSAAKNAESASSEKPKTSPKGELAVASASPVAPPRGSTKKDDFVPLAEVPPAPKRAVELQKNPSDIALQVNALTADNEQAETARQAVKQEAEKESAAFQGMMPAEEAPTPAPKAANNIVAAPAETSVEAPVETAIKNTKAPAAMAEPSAVASVAPAPAVVTPPPAPLSPALNPTKFVPALKDAPPPPSAMPAPAAVAASTSSVPSATAELEPIRLVPPPAEVKGEPGPSAPAPTLAGGNLAPVRLTPAAQVSAGQRLLPDSRYAARRAVDRPHNAVR